MKQSFNKIRSSQARRIAALNFRTVH